MFRVFEVRNAKLKKLWMFLTFDLLIFWSIDPQMNNALKRREVINKRLGAFPFHIPLCRTQTYQNSYVQKYLRVLETQRVPIIIEEEVAATPEEPTTTRLPASATHEATQTVAPPQQTPPPGQRHSTNVQSAWSCARTPMEWQCTKAKRTNNSISNNNNIIFNYQTVHVFYHLKLQLYFSIHLKYNPISRSNTYIISFIFGRLNIIFE